MLVGAVVVLSVLMWPAAASALVGTPKYPNLREMPPIDLWLGKTVVGNQQHYVMSFTARTYNAGPGALEVDRVPQVVPASGLADLKQRIYEDPAGFQDRQLGAVAMTSPFTFDIPAAARYELWTQRAFTRAQRNGFTRGTPLYVREDVRYCISDGYRIDPDATAFTYPECNGVAQGITPGWANVEFFFDPNQYFDVGTAPLPDGKYVVRAIADPDNVLWESPNKADPSKESQIANQGYSSFEIIGGVIVWNG